MRPPPKDRAFSRDLMNRVTGRRRHGRALKARSRTVLVSALCQQTGIVDWPGTDLACTPHGPQKSLGLRFGFGCSTKGFHQSSPVFTSLWAAVEVMLCRQNMTSAGVILPI